MELMIEKERDMTVLVCDEVLKEFTERYDDYLSLFQTMEEKAKAFHDPLVREKITEDSVIAGMAKFEKQFEEDFYNNVLPTLVSEKDLDEEEDKEFVFSTLFGNYLQDHMTLARQIIATTIDDFFYEVMNDSANQR